MNQGLNDRHVSLLAKTARRVTAEHPVCTGPVLTRHTPLELGCHPHPNEEAKAQGKRNEADMTEPTHGQSQDVSSMLHPPELIFPRGPEAR